MTRGITGDGRGRLLNDQLYWIAPERWEPLDVGMPQAYGAASSPDGRRIAFVGAPEQGRVGQEKLELLVQPLPDGGRRERAAAAGRGLPLPERRDLVAGRALAGVLGAVRRARRGRRLVAGRGRHRPASVAHPGRS